jgi:hypothetical protein
MMQLTAFDGLKAQKENRAKSGGLNAGSYEVKSC